MYKKQMTFQKIVCYFELIASAIVFIYSLGIMTDLYEGLYSMIPEPTDLDSEYFAGARIYYDMQGFNQLLTKAGIILILLSVFVIIMQTHVRRKYYIGNYVAIFLSSVASVGSSVWALGKIMAYKQQFLTTVDFETYEMYAKIFKTPYVDSTFWFDLSIPVFGILLLSTVLMILNLIWKIIVTNGEKKLITEGKEAA